MERNYLNVSSFHPTSEHNGVFWHDRGWRLLYFIGVAHVISWVGMFLDILYVSSWWLQIECTSINIYCITQCYSEETYSVNRK